MLPIIPFKKTKSSSETYFHDRHVIEARAARPATTKKTSSRKTSLVFAEVADRRTLHMPLNFSQMSSIGKVEACLNLIQAHLLLSVLSY